MNQCPFVDIDHALAETGVDWPIHSVHGFPGGILLIMNYSLKVIAVALLCVALPVVTKMITENNSIRLVLTLMYTCAFVIFLSRPSMKHQ